MSFRAGAAEAGMRLDAALAARGEAGSRAEAQRLIDAGRRDRGRPARGPSPTGCAEGELVERREPAEEPPPDADAEVPFEVVLEDEHLMVVDKPAGVVVHPGAGRRTGTLAQALRGPRRRRARPRARGDRAPARPRHVGADGGGEVRGGPPARWSR